MYFVIEEVCNGFAVLCCPSYYCRVVFKAVICTSVLLLHEVCYIACLSV